jgi:6,7-dimethyl-8-ribityllumazine synthase
MTTLEGATTAAGLRFAIVVARFNDFVTCWPARSTA